VASAKRHSAPMSGWPGLPSYSSTVEPTSSPPTRKFHIIQPVVVNQKKRSAGPRSRCSASDLRCSSTIPPWPWTIGLGSPVVPEEYRIHSGWSNGTRSKLGFGRFAPAAADSTSSAQVSVRPGPTEPGSPPASCPGAGTSTVAPRVGSCARMAATSWRRSCQRPP
jgi:hypothetical protein